MSIKCWSSWKILQQGDSHFCCSISPLKAYHVNCLFLADQDSCTRYFGHQGTRVLTKDVKDFSA